MHNDDLKHVLNISNAQSIRINGCFSNLKKVKNKHNNAESNSLSNKVRIFSSEKDIICNGSLSNESKVASILYSSAVSPDTIWNTISPNEDLLSNALKYNLSSNKYDAFASDTDNHVSYIQNRPNLKRSTSVTEDAKYINVTNVINDVVNSCTDFDFVENLPVIKNLEAGSRNRKQLTTGVKKNVKKRKKPVSSNVEELCMEKHQNAAQSIVNQKIKAKSCKNKNANKKIYPSADFVLQGFDGTNFTVNKIQNKKSNKFNTGVDGAIFDDSNNSQIKKDTVQLTNNVSENYSTKIFLRAKHNKTRGNKWRMDNGTRHEALQRIEDGLKKIEKYHRDLFPFSVEASDSDQDYDEEENEIAQSGWFYSSIAAPFNTVDSNSRINLMRTELNRQFRQAKAAHNLYPGIPKQFLQSVVQAARKYPCETAYLLNPGMKQKAHGRTNKTLVLTKQKCCKDGCENISLPCTEHCIIHILDCKKQVLLERCRIREIHGGQCLRPVLNVKFKQPVCSVHAKPNFVQPYISEDIKFENSASDRNTDCKPTQTRKQPTKRIKTPKEGTNKESKRKVQKNKAIPCQEMSFDMKMLPDSMIKDVRMNFGSNTDLNIDSFLNSYCGLSDKEDENVSHYNYMNNCDKNMYLNKDDKNDLLGKYSSTEGIKNISQHKFQKFNNIHGNKQSSLNHLQNKRVSNLPNNLLNKLLSIKNDSIIHINESMADPCAEFSVTDTCTENYELRNNYLNNDDLKNGLCDDYLNSSRFHIDNQYSDAVIKTEFKKEYIDCNGVQDDTLHDNYIGSFDIKDDINYVTTNSDLAADILLESQNLSDYIKVEDVIEEVEVIDDGLVRTHLDSSELASQDLAQHEDITTALNDLPPDAFNELFLEDKNESRWKETEELERALQEVDKDVQSLTRSQGIIDPSLLLEEIESSGFSNYGGGFSNVALSSITISSQFNNSKNTGC